MPSQNLQDAFLNSARKERAPVTIYLTSGVKLSGRVRGFDKYCVVFETNHQEQLIFKHAISTVVAPRGHASARSEGPPQRAATHGDVAPRQPPEERQPADSEHAPPPVVEQTGS